MLLLATGCSWDSGECSLNFQRAGERGAQACDRAACPYKIEGDVNEPCQSGCFEASCDFQQGHPACAAILTEAAACPLFDAVTWQSLSAVPDLVFVREGGTAAGYGRCNGACNQTPHPDLPDWCTSPACHVEPGDSERPWCKTGAIPEAKAVVSMGLHCAIACANASRTCNQE